MLNVGDLVRKNLVYGDGFLKDEGLGIVLDIQQKLRKGVLEDWVKVYWSQYKKLDWYPDRSLKKL